MYVDQKQPHESVVTLKFPDSSLIGMTVCPLSSPFLQKVLGQTPPGSSSLCRALVNGQAAGGPVGGCARWPHSSYSSLHCNAEEEEAGEAVASCAGGRHGKRKALKAFLHKLRHAPAHATAAPDTIPASLTPPGLSTLPYLCHSVVTVCNPALSWGMMLLLLVSETASPCCNHAICPCTAAQYC